MVVVPAEVKVIVITVVIIILLKELYRFYSPLVPSPSSASHSYLKEEFCE